MNAKDDYDSESGWTGLRVFIFLTVIVPVLLLAVFVQFRVGSVEETLANREAFVRGAPGNRDETRTEVDSLPWHPVEGQQVYVPAYSHVFHQKGDPYLLTVTLYVRNTSIRDEIVISSVRYFDTTGRELRSLLQKPLKLGPLAATEFVIQRDDEIGGSGASFLVEWTAGNMVTPPLVESIMIDTSSGQGISFRSPGIVLDEQPPFEAASQGKK
jgi:hypothetical protein